jgi:non-ribosomal peptide synthetase-like protein
LGGIVQNLRQNLKVLPLPQKQELSTLQDVFSWCAQTYSKNIALEFEKKRLTYGELKIHVVHFANYLRSRGVKRGDFVVLYMPRGIDMFIGLLGIIEAGAVYVPMDPHAPIDRVTYVYKDCQAKFIVTDSTLMKPDFSVACIYFDQIREGLSKVPYLSRESDSSCTGDDLAYVIYTSGSTGQPKGVMIRQHSIVHFIYSESSILELRSNDVILQGFSLSFDMSLEEIWTAFFAGSKLIIASHELMTSGPDLAPLLSDMGITVWHCVPTLLAMQQMDIPSLRLLNLGGEACPSHLVDRWSRKGRRLINTYGPTETTVTATYAELQLNKPITIGKGLPGYETYVLDEQLMPVEHGKEGELCIGGPGLAAGYINRADLTAEKFILAPFSREDGSALSIYRTGDLVRLNSEDDIEFLGRFDTQIKIRGFRVELSEIESVLMQVSCVQTAIVALLKDNSGFDALIAFVILTEDKGFQEAHAWQQLRTKLPPYMIPSLLEVVEDLPRLPSGKVDRKKLQFPKRVHHVHKTLKEPGTPMEKKIHQVWTELFSPIPVSIEDDFFLDLGGHSLRAALMISKLRKEQGLSSVSIQAVYKHRSIATLAAFLEEKEKEYEGKEPIGTKFKPVPQLRYLSCVTAQALSLVFIFSFLAFQWFLPYIAYFINIERGHSLLSSFGISIAISMLVLPLSFLLSIATKWIVIGRYKEGDYPLWGSYYFRWWFVRRVSALVPYGMFRGTPLLNLYFRMLGSKIGKNVFLNTESCDTWDLLSIGDASTLSQGVTFSCSSIEGGLLKLRKIRIGENCFVGDGAVLGMSTVMEEGSQLEDLSLLSNNKTIPTREVWSGSPARQISSVDSVPARDSNRMPMLLSFLQVVLTLTLSLFSIVPLLPGLVFMLTYHDSITAWVFVKYAPLLASSYIVFTCLMIAALKWLILGRVKPGMIPLASFNYLRFWFVTHLMDMSLASVRPIYATLYLAPWFRMLGVKLGKRAEVSTASGVPLDLLSIADESFVADGVTLGVPRIANGYLELKETTIGTRTFLGNSALIPGGTHLADNMLIGCLSVPPRSSEQRSQSFASWFGSPAIYLPQRQMFNEFDDKTTFYPSRKLYALRLFIEGIRIILPATLSTLFSIFVLASFFKIYTSDLSTFQKIACLPFLYCALGFAAILTTAALKYLLMGTYTPTVQPLWSHFVWRSELVTTLYENFPVPFFMDHLRGTPFLNMCLRLMGSKVGKRVYTDTTDMTEHDMIEIGDDVALNDNCGLQTHLFEERIMKVSRIKVEERCTVGALAIVLYDAVMEHDSQLGDLSMLMKGETLPASTEWEGLPAQRVS